MNILILGANSDIARAMAHTFARREGATLLLASRDVDSLALTARDIELRHQVKTQVLRLDATDFASHTTFLESLSPRPDGVIFCVGSLGDQAEQQRDFGQARDVIETNYLSAVSLLEPLAAEFEAKRRGFIIGVGSVAGLRGRQSNYIYGSAKAGFGAYMSGLRHRLFKSEVKVLTVLPGFVRTKMTAHLELPSALLAEPEEVAEAAHDAWRKGKGTIYVKWMWRWIMLIITHLPDFVFKRTQL